MLPLDIDNCNPPKKVQNDPTTTLQHCITNGKRCTTPKTAKHNNS